ncbi:hypothetical protein [Sulfuriroseicoccus oceanibius]|uniref:Secreted protein n=1 Tax=Sulfuriroseicoccus oceanibius TaxID=2707525 RepID=A0A6B3LD13_9BACT|nr:hypothetical protein [Sulfuriroseicoccus oceanibius]QQL44727.1 hypothetical protein G3M56_012720 [Sulfuriroseicoccus oceanibius]
MRIPSILVGFAALTHLTVGAEEPAAPAEAHVIEVARPYVEGDAFYEDTTLRINQHAIEATEAGESTTTTNAAHIRFIGDQLVTKVTPGGIPSSLLIRIERLEVSSFDNGKKAEQPDTLLEKGSWVIAESVGGEVAFTNTDGTKFENAQATNILDELIGLRDEDPALPLTTTLALGPEHPRRPGESWKLDPAANAKAMSSRKYPLTPDDIAGYATYMGKVESHGRPCDRLSYTYSIDTTRHQNMKMERFDRVSYHRIITLDLPEDPNLKENHFTMSRWVRYDQSNPAPESPTAPATSSLVYEMLYQTDVLEIEGEQLEILRAKHAELQAKEAAEAPAQAKEPT